MKIQKSRNSRQPAKDYSSVCHQQGRMLTDSDLNEQALLSRDRLSSALGDVIGSGTPRHGGLLRVTDVGDQRIPSLHWGRAYTDGIPAQVRASSTAPDGDIFDYDHQLYYPEAPALPVTPYRLYLDVWERSVVWLEDEILRDPGLHGADTTARTQTTAQVKWCDITEDPLCTDINPSIGDARLRLVLRSLSTSADPCDPCADELELSDPVGNYLFRVEIHDVVYDASSLPEALVLKWSSENGAEAYPSSDVPPDFAASQYVYEFFDEVTEKRLGAHLARDTTGQRIIDGSRQPLTGTFSESSPLAKDYVRRWDGWCRIEKSGSDWQLTEGFEGTIDLTSGVGAGKPGHVTQGGDLLSVELRLITLSLELADHPLIAGDYWTTPVREAIHQQGETLLGDPVTAAGVPPEGEPHHFMLLVDVDGAGEMTLPGDSACDPYGACKATQFPSLTDLRAADVCYRNDACEMPEVITVQDAIDHLCQERDLRWHNRHLHGWGVVCGLALECDPENPDGVILSSGYALDCDGTDMVVEGSLSINVPERLKEAGIDPDTVDEDQGVCLFLEYTPDQELDVGIELYSPDKNNWLERFRDTLLYDFYQDCVLDLITTLTGELQQDDVAARCALTRCGRQEIRPAQRRTLTLTNILFQYNQGEADTVLNISHCEHALMQDLYSKLREILRSRTFCAQFQNQDFPKYPFPDQPCRATWFTPGTLDHIRAHPNGKLLFGWRRNSARVFVFELLKEPCLGDLSGYFDVPQIENGTITDISVAPDGIVHVVGIVHQEDSLFARGKLPEINGDECLIPIDWETSFLCGVKIVRLRQSPWSDQLQFAVGLCKGVYLIDPDELFSKEKIERDPDWGFPASGHMEFDVRGAKVFATASAEKLCEEGRYDRLVMFNGLKSEGDSSLLHIHPVVNQQPIRGGDGFVLSNTLDEGDDVPGTPGLEPSKGLVLFIVADINDHKILCRFDGGLLKGESWNGVLYHQFGAAGRISLKYLRGKELDGVVASRYAMHDLQYIPGNPRDYNKGLLPGIPVQAGPVEVLVSDKLGQIHVLNHMGQSITLLNYELQIYQEQVDELRTYRKDVIAAFYQLLSGLLQYLKDCFCNHLLVRCPECDEDDKVYLGCLSLRDGEVYNICNFTKRRFVKTTETLYYWLSIIPIGPLVGWLVEELCCLVLPNYFKQREPNVVGISPQQLGMANAVVHTDYGNIMESVTSASKQLARTGLGELVGAGYRDKRDYQELVGLEYNYRPGVFQPAVTKAPSNDQLKKQVDEIQLGRARTVEEVSALQSELTTLRAEKAAADQRFQALEADYQNVLVTRVAAVEADKQRAEQEVSELKGQITQLQQEKNAVEQRFSVLEKNVSELNQLRTNVEPIVNAAQPVSSIEGVAAEDLAILERNNIRTVGQLAEVDTSRLTELGINRNAATSMVKQAGDRVRIKSP